jgi:hypothetical protein
MKQDLNRRIVNISLLFSPILYIVLALVLISAEGILLVDFQLPMIILVVSILICFVTSLTYVSKNWVLEGNQDIAEQVSKDVIRLAIRQLIVLPGLTYFVIALGGI